MLEFFWVCRVMNSKRCLYSGSVVIESFFQVEKGKKELRKRSAEVRGALVEWKDKAARPGTKLKGPEEF